MKENEKIEFKKSTSEINEAMNSISAILNKHKYHTQYRDFLSVFHMFRQSK